MRGLGEEISGGRHGKVGCLETQPRRGVPKFGGIERVLCVVCCFA
jgi:hypothetical protein